MAKAMTKDISGQEFHDVIDQYQAISQQYQQIHQQCQQLQQTEHRLKHEQQRLSRYLLAQMNQNKVKTVEVGQVQINIQAYQQRLVIDHIDAIPDDYVSINTTRHLDKPALKNSLLKGKAIPGAHIETESKIRIEKIK